MDDEITGMFQVAKILEELVEDARARVLRWAADKFGVDLGQLAVEADEEEADPEQIRIRQIAICTPDIRPVEREIERALDITPAHRDRPGAPIWMFNGVFAVGNTFLEILQPERPEAPTQKFLEKQGGAAGYMLILQVDDLAKARARAEAADVRIVMDMPLREYHGVKGAGIHLHPGDTGGVCPGPALAGAAQGSDPGSRPCSVHNI